MQTRRSSLNFQALAIGAILKIAFTPEGYGGVAFLESLLDKKLVRINGYNRMTITRIRESLRWPTRTFFLTVIKAFPDDFSILRRYWEHIEEISEEPAKKVLEEQSQYRPPIISNPPDYFPPGERVKTLGRHFRVATEPRFGPQRISIDRFQSFNYKRSFDREFEII